VSRSSTPVRLAVATAVVSACAAAPPAQAQTGSPSRETSRFELDIGAAWIGSANFGTRPATETAPSGPRFVLFSTSTRLDGAVGIEARVGYRLTSVFEIEAVTSYSAPKLSTTIASDAENASPATAVVGVKQLTIGGAIVAHLTRFAIGRRAVPFAEGGVAYLRQLYDTPAAAVGGQAYEVGGGVKYIVGRRPGARVSAVGIRGDIRAVARRGGVAPDGGTHLSPAAGASLFLSF